MRRMRRAMEKVWECGVMFSRDAWCEDRKVRSERESGDVRGDIFQMIGRNYGEKEMKNGPRTHVGMDVRRHIVRLEMREDYDVSEKHFETNLHRS